MPRASYGDKYTVTVMKNEDDHIVLDLSSKIVDFQVEYQLYLKCRSDWEWEKGLLTLDGL